MIFKKCFPFYLQYDPMDCGPWCLAMLAAHYGKDYPCLTEGDQLCGLGRHVTGLFCATPHGKSA
jgi:ATP-binding cassette subfamily B protein